MGARAGGGPEARGLVVALVRALEQASHGASDGVLVVDGRVRVVVADRRATRELADGRLLRVDRDERLVCRLTAQTRALRERVAIAAEGEEREAVVRLSSSCLDAEGYLLVRPHADPAWRLAGRPPAAVVTLHDARVRPHVDQRVLRGAYGLSAAEARVAAALVGGRGVPAAARSLHLSEHTVRTHLKRIFDKTGMARQAQLVALLLGGPASRRSRSDLGR